jgi:hypothetical protein
MDSGAYAGSGDMDSGLLKDAGTGETGGITAIHFSAPQVAPIVRNATPSALRPAVAISALRAARELFAALAVIGSAQAQPAMVNVNDSIKALFKDTYNKMSGGQGQGLINSHLEDLDTRMKEVDRNGSTSECIKNTPYPFRVNLSAVAPAIDITLNLQCRAGTLMVFGRGKSGPIFDEDSGAPSIDGGIADDSMTYSLWLYLQHRGTADSAFGYFANVQNVGTGNEAVDFLYLENSSEVPRIAAFRVKARPSTKSFEFVYGATDGDGAAGGNLLCGFKMISDGVSIWAVGKDLQPGQTCAEAAPFTRCLSAIDLTEQSSDAPCAKLKTSFTMEAPTPNALSAAGTEVTNKLPVATAYAYTRSF